MPIASRVNIVPLDFDDDELLGNMSSSISQAFQIPTRIVPMDIRLDMGRNRQRDQLNSTWVLSQLLSQSLNNSDKILGITVHDLYTPILTYLFGEAELGGRAAVVSTYRFRDELYGLPANKDNLEKRIEKEAVHELGHTFGLVHCLNFDCVMHASTYIEEFDYKTNSFCPLCVSLLDERTNT